MTDSTNISLTISQPGEAFIVGSVMPIDMTLQNLGNTSIPNLPSKLQVSQFEYSLFSSDSIIIQTFSSKKRTALLNGGFSRDPQGKLELLPAMSTKYHVDLSSHLIEPLDCADYFLQARIKTHEGVIESELTPIKVVAPDIHYLSHILNDERDKLTSILISRVQGDKLSISKRTSASMRPNLGTFQPLGHILTGPSINHLCMAQSDEASINWNWTLWIEDEMIAGAMTWDYNLKYPFSGFMIGLENPRILGGFQNSQGHATFIIVGTNDNIDQLKLFHINGIDDFTTADCQFNLPSTASIRMQVNFNKEVPEVTLLWLESVKLYSTIIDGKTGASIRSASEIENKLGSIIDFNLSKVTLSDSNLAPVLIENTDSDERIIYTLAHLDMNSLSFSTRFVLPHSSAPLHDWILPDQGSIKTPVIARSEDKYYHIEAGLLSQWQLLTEVPSNSEELQILTFKGDESWLTYHTSINGIAFLQLQQ